MAVVPKSTELAAAVARMEAQFDADPRTRTPMAAYRALCTRFVDDLADPRDIMLSRAAALMMIKYQFD